VRIIGGYVRDEGVVPMGMVRIAVSVMLAGGALVATVEPAGAASSAKACDALDTLQEDIEALGDISEDSLNPTVKELEATYRGQAAAYKKAAKNVPKKLKSALEKLAENYGAIQDDVYGADEGAEATKFFASKKYTKALSKYRKYSLKNCQPA
jgi:uncharacterized alpha/beta hydrolase family protein